MENSNRTILVTGATGHQGSAVAHHLLKRGNFQVRALVRDKHTPAAQSLHRLGAELFVGDLNQQAGAEMTTMYRWFESVGYGADLAQLKRDFPAPTDFESYLREHDWVKQAA